MLQCRKRGVVLHRDIRRMPVMAAETPSGGLTTSSGSSRSPCAWAGVATMRKDTFPWTCVPKATLAVATAGQFHNHTGYGTSPTVMERMESSRNTRSYRPHGTFSSAGSVTTEWLPGHAGSAQDSGQGAEAAVSPRSSCEAWARRLRKVAAESALHRGIPSTETESPRVLVLASPKGPTCAPLVTCATRHR